MDENGETDDYPTAKIVLIGDSGVGKTNILSRISRNQFSPSVNSTIGVEYASKVLTLSNQKKIKIQIWDTAGQERFQSVSNTYFSKSKGAMVVFDLTKSSTFHSVDNWIKILQKAAGVNISILLVGNKSDLKKSRAVAIDEALTKARDIGPLPYIETSAMNNINITEAFSLLGENIYQLHLSSMDIKEEKERSKDSFIIHDDNSHIEKKRACC